MIYCTNCGDTVEKTNGWYECFCWQVDALPDEDGQMGLYDGPKDWVVMEVAAECLRLFGSLEAAQACKRREAAYAAYVAGELTREQLEALNG